MEQKEKRRLKKNIIFVVGAIALLLSLSLFALSKGVMNISYHSIINALLKAIGFSTTEMDSVAYATIIKIRLPRILGAVFIGGGLAVSGAVLQSILLNPLADPYTLGISSGAAFGAAIILVLPMLHIIDSTFFMSVEVAAFLGAIATLLSVL
jgi:iron complex transport system permease protein